jgi:4-amino-4-deoxy-L-arabinose transferase-like glycosyltransferase
LLSQGGDAIVIGTSGGNLETEAATRNAVLMLIAATAVARLVFAATLGLGIDETYTVATSRQLQMGYFDHPPMAWWMTWAMRALTGSEHPLLMRLPFVATFALTTWFVYALTRLLYGLRAGFWAAVIVNIPPVIGWTTGSWVLPDGPLYAALTGGAYALARVLFVSRESPVWWLIAGVAGGVALLSKLHGGFLFAGALLFLMTSSRYRIWLATPWPYAGSLIALLLLAPALVWNAQHDWISVTFQAQRGEARQFNLGALLALLSGQMLFLLPLVWLALVVVGVKAVRKGPASARDWLLVCLGSGPIIVFTLIGLWAHRVLPHWAMPGYLLLTPLLGREVARALALSQRWVKPFLWLGAGTTGVLVPVIVIIALLPWPVITLFGSRPVPDPLIETVSWAPAARELRRRGLLDAPGLVAVGTSWHEAAKLDVALGGLAPVLCLALDPRGYGINVRAPDFVGRDAVIVGHTLTPAQIEGTYAPYFEALTREPDIVVPRNGRPALTLLVYRAKQLHAAESPAPVNLLDPLGAWSGRIVPAH